jgi:hypothetical protein
MEPSPPPSLLKFATPLLVSGVDENGVPVGKPLEDESASPKRSADFRHLALGEGKMFNQTNEILNALLPPRLALCANDLLLSHCREWTENGQTWMQYTCSEPASRLDVMSLQVGP